MTLQISWSKESEMSNIVILKTLVGEEIIATRCMEGENVFEKVRVFRISSDGQGGTKAGLVPFFVVAPDAVLPINQALILSEITCPPDVERAYLEATSGIMLTA